MARIVKEKTPLEKAAPELLATLKEVVGRAELGLDSPDGDQWEAALRDILGCVRAAIAKAEGRE